ncbi:hypothetical protein [Flavobacterium lacus]|jgi:hypothetical protein|uniref:Uncharacterized protein n=1 Tax=Flavobacterium lacus TaxID=1353778 RepID=A0A328WLD7_9FLAO|nr:hypothetical protein [Flavobacterium lacus]RAR47152.1 hypothetical protein B0I10_11162 [Flavobacterium lacus]
MLVNTSYNEKKINQAINDLVGNPFGLLDNIKLNGVGSPRLDITKTSEEIATLLSYDNNRNFCNIELRPNGIIIRFRSLLETFSLVIPFYKLVVFKPGNSVTLHMDHHFISIDAPPKNKSVNSFIEKINQFKANNSPTYIDDL